MPLQVSVDVSMCFYLVLMSSLIRPERIDLPTGANVQVIFPRRPHSRTICRTQTEKDAQRQSSLLVKKNADAARFMTAPLRANK